VGSTRNPLITAHLSELAATLDKRKSLLESGITQPRFVSREWRAAGLELSLCPNITQKRVLSAIVGAIVMMPC